MTKVKTNCTILVAGEPTTREDDITRPIDVPARSWPEGDPSTDWKRSELDAWCEANGLSDLTSAKTKAELVSAIAAATEEG